MNPINYVSDFLDILPAWVRKIVAVLCVIYVVWPFDFLPVNPIDDIMPVLLAAVNYKSLRS